MSDVGEETTRLTCYWHLTSDISSWRNYAYTLARPAVRFANVDEKSRLHADRRAHAGPRHRREHGRVQRGLCDASAPAAFQGSGAAGRRVEERRDDQTSVRRNIHPGVQRLAESESGLRTSGGDDDYDLWLQLYADRAGRAGAD